MAQGVSEVQYRDHDEVKLSATPKKKGSGILGRIAKVLRREKSHSKLDHDILDRVVQPVVLTKTNSLSRASKVHWQDLQEFSAEQVRALSRAQMKTLVQQANDEGQRKVPLSYEQIRLLTPSQYRILYPLIPRETLDELFATVKESDVKVRIRSLTSSARKSFFDDLPPGNHSDFEAEVRYESDSKLRLSKEYYYTSTNQSDKLANAEIDRILRRRSQVIEGQEPADQT